MTAVCQSINTGARNPLLGFVAWLLNDPRRLEHLSETERQALDPVRVAAFVVMHIACLSVLWVGASWVAIFAALIFYALRMFFVTAFYHRYFSHRAFKTSRWFQFAMATAGCTAGQRGPVWWASHHREHHSHADTPSDPHSPHQVGFIFSHTGWFLTNGSFETIEHRVRDWLLLPELRWLERLDWVPLIGLGFLCYALGAILDERHPHLNTSGPQMLVWGFFISTVLLYHATYSINSLCHRFGTRRFDTSDHSRNNWWLAILTMGEGWHNNHHRYPGAARQGFRWWEIDMSYIGLRVLKHLRLVRNLREVPLPIKLDERTEAQSA